jgi:outer membrane lipoprotein-sorting protein
MAGPSCFALTGNDIVKKADDMRFIDTDVSFQVEVEDIKGSSRLKTRYKVYNKGAKASRVETTFPERSAGRKILMTNDDLWLFTPDIKRPTRISLQQRLTGEVANGDIARTQYSEDYNAEIKGEENLGGQELYHLLLTKKKDEVTYPAIEYWVSKKDFAPVKALFKTDSGKVLKSAVYKEPKSYLNHKMITRIEIQNALNKDQRSILTFSSYKKENLDASFFNKETLNN